jgi:hypothetical protein
MSWGRRATLALATLAIVMAGCGLVQIRRAARAARITQTAEAASHPLIVECRWERPVVGGAARDCNGIVAADDAAKRLLADAPEGMMAKASLLDLLEHDRALPADVSAFVASHGKALAEVREAARCSWACRREASLTNYRRGTANTTNELLLFAARASTPEECMHITIDVMRLVQDGETGLHASFAGRGTSREARWLHEARRTLLECGRSASGPALEEAARQVVVVATTPPPVGDALAIDALFTATALLEDVVQPDRANVLWVQRGALLDVADGLVAHIDTFRTYRDDDDFPAALDRLSHDLPPRPWLPFSFHTPDVVSFFDVIPDDFREVLRGHAHVDRDLRATAVAIAALRDRVTDGAWKNGGPAERTRRELRDPFTGEPFEWELSAAGPVLFAKAIGEADAEAIGLSEPAP